MEKCDPVLAFQNFANISNISDLKTGRFILGSEVSVHSLLVLFLLNLWGYRTSL